MAIFELVRQNQMKKKTVVVKLELREREDFMELLGENGDNEDEKFETMPEENPEEDRSNYI